MSIETLLSSADGTDRAVDLRDKLVDRIRDDELLWIDITGDDEAEVRIVRDALGLEDDVVEALGRDLEPPPDAAVLTGAVELTILWLDDDQEPAPVQVLAGDGWVITRHPRPLESLNQQRA